MPEEQAPPVVAVVVAADSGPWLEECLEALAVQDYQALTVLVVDAGSAEPLAGRVAAVAPDFYYHRLEDNPGFGPAANVATTLVEGVSHYLFCHDDVIAAPECVRRLMEEGFRSNAGIVAPKLVDYDDPDRILQLGLGVDRFGAPVRRVEHREFDQSQHDEPREVFAAPGGCTLVRADLIAAIGGFDPAISMFGEDVDLCWRAHVAGARVVTAPLAVVRHLEATSARRRPLPQARSLQWRHELRSVLKNYGRTRRALVVTQLAILSAAEVVYFLALGRRSRARQVIEAWRWNLSRRAELQLARANLAAVRVVDDREVARLFSRRTFRVWRFLRPVLEDLVLRWSKRGEMADTTGRHHARGHRERRPRAVTAIAVVAFLIVLFGSRSLIIDGLPLLGRFLPMPSPFHLIGEFLGGFTNAGMQRPGPASPGFALLGLAGLVTLGGMGLLMKVLLAAAIAIGAFGVARVVRPFGSPVARLAGAVVYLFLPLPYDDLARGDITGLVLYAAMPYVLSRLARSTGLVRVGARPDSKSLMEEALGFGVLLAVIGALAPIALPIALVAAVALVVGSLVSGETASGLRALRVTFGAAIVAIVADLPWSATFFQVHAQLAILGGALVGAANSMTLGQLLRFDVGPIGNSLLDWAFLVGAVFVLFIAHAERFDWAVRLWFVGLGTAAFAWVAEEGWIGPGGSDIRALIAPFGACVAALVGLAVASLEEDLARRHFGWRHVAAGAFGLVTVAGVLPVLGSSFGGRWGTPTNGFESVLSFVAAPGASGQGQRTLYLGESHALPLNAWQIDPGLALGVSDGGLPTIEAMYSTPSPGAATTLIDAVHLAETGRTVRLGARLASFGIRYLVVPTAIAPVLTGTQTAAAAPPPQVLLDGLAAQQDLRELPPVGGTLVFEDTAWRSGVIVPAVVAGPGGTPSVLRVLGVAAEIALWLVIGGYYVARRRRRSARRQRRHVHEQLHEVTAAEAVPEPVSVA